MRNYFFIVGLIALLLVSCGKIKDPVFNNISNVELTKPGLDRSSMSFDMECFNPNNIKAKMKEAEGDAWLDSTYLGHFRVDTMVNIPANAHFTIPVKLDVEMKNMLKFSLAALLNEDVWINIKGRAKVGKSGFYKRFLLNYRGKQNLRELFKQ